MRFGRWIEKHFPEKLTAAEVDAHFERYDIELKTALSELCELSKTTHQLISDSATSWKNLNDRIAKLEQDFSVIKTQVTIKSRVIGAQPSAMTPFASRFIPNPGEAKSPQ